MLLGQQAPGKIVLGFVGDGHEVGAELSAFLLCGREREQIVHDEGGLIIVAFVDYINGVSKKIGFGEIGGAYPSDNGRMSERWWMA